MGGTIQGKGHDAHGQPAKIPPTAQVGRLPAGEKISKATSKDVNFFANIIHQLQKLFSGFYHDLTTKNRKALTGQIDTVNVLVDKLNDLNLKHDEKSLIAMLNAINTIVRKVDKLAVTGPFAETDKGKIKAKVDLLKSMIVEKVGNTRRIRKVKSFTVSKIEGTPKAPPKKALKPIGLQKKTIPEGDEEAVKSPSPANVGKGKFRPATALPTDEDDPGKAIRDMCAQVRPVFIATKMTTAEKAEAQKLARVEGGFNAIKETYMQTEDHQACVELLDAFEPELKGLPETKAKAEMVAQFKELRDQASDTIKEEMRRTALYQARAPRATEKSESAPAAPAKDLPSSIKPVSLVAEKQLIASRDKFLTSIAQFYSGIRADIVPRMVAAQQDEYTSGKWEAKYAQLARLMDKFEHPGENIYGGPETRFDDLDVLFKDMEAAKDLLIEGLYLARKQDKHLVPLAELYSTSGRVFLENLQQFHGGVRADAAVEALVVLFEAVQTVITKGILGGRKPLANDNRPNDNRPLVGAIEKLVDDPLLLYTKQGRAAFGTALETIEKALGPNEHLVNDDQIDAIKTMLEKLGRQIGGT